MARKTFPVTDAMRERVRRLSGVGVPQDDIANIIGCDAKTLRKHFRYELDRGAAEADAAVASYLFAKRKRRQRHGADLLAEEGALAGAPGTGGPRSGRRGRVDLTGDHPAGQRPRSRGHRGAAKSTRRNTLPENSGDSCRKVNDSTNVPVIGGHHVLALKVRRKGRQATSPRELSSRTRS